MDAQPQRVRGQMLLRKQAKFSSNALTYIQIIEKHFKENALNLRLSKNFGRACVQAALPSTRQVSTLEALSEESFQRKLSYAKLFNVHMALCCASASLVAALGQRLGSHRPAERFPRREALRCMCGRGCIASAWASTMVRGRSQCSSIHALGMFLTHFL